MNNQISTFKFSENHSIRTIADEKGEFWFLANDVCGVLGYVNPRDAVSKHCKLKGVAKRDTPTESGNQEMTYINEPNLYRLIIKSRKPEAEAFEEWVMEDVLPTIRKTGSYQTSGCLKTKTALPNGLTLEQQDEIKKFHRELVQTAPKEKQAKLAIQLWSSVKSKFGVSYKEVASEHYPEVLSLMARVAVEQNQALSGEVLDKLDKQQNPKLPHDYFAHLAKMAFYADHYLKIQELMCNNPNSKEAKSLADSLAFSSSTNPNQTGYLFVFKPNIKQDVTDAMSLLHDYSLMM